MVHTLSQEFSNVSLTMVGPDKDGSLDACKKLAAELSISPLIQYTGRLSVDEWISLSAGHDIFINTTNFDNLPVSVIEAMALGMPVVSTNVGGLKYLIKHRINGMLVNPGSELEFVAAIKYLLNNSAFTHQLSEGARHTAETFDVTRVMQLWNKLLTEA